jgi:GNAT superfamily N-acetyltransferase
LSERFTIRRATMDDIEALVELRLALQSENGAGEDSVEWVAVGEACRRYFAETLPTEVFVVFVAEAQGRIIATSGLSFVSRPPGRSSFSQSEAYVTNVYTIPVWRGKGVATAVLNETIGFAQQRGARLVFLHTSDAGRSLYEKLGFAEYPRYLERRL